MSYGKLGEWAAGLKKGAYVQIEGELRSREYDKEVAVGKKSTTAKCRVWECYAESILKLDGAERHDSGQADRVEGEPAGDQP